jgi:hypothetical protein
MKALLNAVLIASALCAPAFAFAQTANAPVTRAEVKADLVRLEQAGYQPARVSPDYPADIQAAEAKVAAQGEAPEATSFGGVSTGVALSGAPSATNASNDAQSVYGLH